MQKLILLRHAEAHAIETSGDDHERALSKRGEDEARAAGGWLAAHGVAPDRVLCSPALRTDQTARLVLKQLANAPAPHTSGEIYDATPGELLALLDQHNDAHTLMLVGHNPGVERLVALMVEGCSDQFRGMPPGGLAILHVAGVLEPGNARLDAFWSP